MANWNYVVGSSSYNYLTQNQKIENARLLATYLRTQGWTDIAISGLLGNIEHEGVLNPGQCEVNYGIPSGNSDTSYAYGLGLIQWTKPSGGSINPLLRFAQEQNKDWYDGDLQAEYLTHADDSLNYNLWGWISTTTYPQTFAQFKELTSTPSQAASIWLYNVERPGSYASESARQQNAEEWYDIIVFQPRLDYSGTDTLPYYTTYNPYWSWGTVVIGGQSVTAWLGMNNCTAYAFGRWNELAQVTAYNTNWPIGDGADWVADGIAKGYQSGNVPQLGAAISWKGANSNHVAIVEEIQYDSNGNPVSFTISQSAFNNNQPAPNTGQRGPQQAGYNYFPWFWTDTVYMNDLDYDYEVGSFQGFLYHPSITPSPTPPTPPTPTGRKMPFIFYLKRPL